MKRVSLKTFVVVAIFFYSVNTSMAQSMADKQEAIKYAESFKFSNAVTSLENLCCIIFDKGIYILSIDITSYSSEGTAKINTISYSTKDADRSSPIVIPSGQHLVRLNLFFNKRDFLGNLVIVVESGKYYKIGVTDGDKSRYKSFIEPLTDPELLLQAQNKMEEYKKYFLFQEVHPNRFDGKWSGEGSKLMHKFVNQYSFNGNKVKFEGVRRPKWTYFTEGSIIYNENTIIFFPEITKFNRKEIGYNKTPYIWYYTITDNELHLEEGKDFPPSPPGWLNSGIFHKVD
jgi:hypothetical protein